MAPASSHKEFDSTRHKSRNPFAHSHSTDSKIHEEQKKRKVSHITYTISYLSGGNTSKRINKYVT